MKYKSPKYCPLSFMAFFVNKTKAQEGGCNRCLEEQCALWREVEDEDGNTYGMCALLSMADSLSDLAEVTQDKNYDKYYNDEEEVAPASQVEEKPLNLLFSQIRSKTDAQQQPPSLSPQSQQLQQQSQQTSFSEGLIGGNISSGWVSIKHVCQYQSCNMEATKDGNGYCLMHKSNGDINVGK